MGATLPPSSHLRRQNLTELPPTIGQLQHLRTLDLGHNRLAAIPESLGRLTGLGDFLYLRDNQLGTLPAGIAELANLRQLDLRGNPLRSLPSTLSSLPKLEKLDLRWVETLMLPPWLDTLEARGCAVYR